MSTNTSAPKGGDIIDNIFDSTVNARQINSKAVLFQLGIMAAFSVVTLFVFEILRPANKRIYQPKSKYYVGEKKPPPVGSGIFSWVSPLIHTKEPQMLEQLGLDAVTFLRFLRMLRWLFLCIAILTCGVLIPVNYIYNADRLKKQPAKNKKQVDFLSELTITNLKGNILFAHVAVVYVITILVMIFVWFNWVKMVELRKKWFRSPEYYKSFYARTLMITSVPKPLQSDDGLSRLFSSANMPYPTTSVHIGRRVGQLPELVKYHNETVRQLEMVLVRYLRNGKIAKKRPFVTQGGFLGIGGKKFDAIDFYTQKLRKIEQAIEQWRETIDLRKAESYGFASLAAVPYAHIVALRLKRKRLNGAFVQLAPNPKDIIWENLSASSSTVSRKRVLGWTYLILFCAFNTLPLLVISILANLQSLTAYVTFLANWAAKSNDTFAIVSGVLPPMIMGIFAVIFPMVLRAIGRYQGCTTNSKLDRIIVQRYFAFLIISQLIIFTLIGVLVNAIKAIVDQIGKHKSFQEIISSFDKLPANINTTYIRQSSYWLTWFPLRGFLFVFDLAQVVNFAWLNVKTHMFGRTPRDIREWTKPPDFEYATYYSNLLFMAAVALVFAPLAPLVVALAAVMFFISATVYKYQLIFVFTTKVESGGRIWNVVINRLLMSVVFMQLLMILTMGLQRGWRSLEWLASVPPVIFIIFFKILLSRRFSKEFKYYVPTPEELSNAHIHSTDAKGHRLQRRFGHPALHADLFTPMVHAKMTHLLPEVYHGRLSTTETVVAEYGGAKLETQVAPGGIKIAGVDQNDLEYDLTLYQRDRGELDWDQQSIGSSTLLSDTSSVYGMKPIIGGEGKPLPLGYEEYMAYGPRQGGITQAAMNSSDHVPLLTSGGGGSSPGDQRPGMQARDSSYYGSEYSQPSPLVQQQYPLQQHQHQYPPPSRPGTSSAPGRSTPTLPASASEYSPHHPHHRQSTYDYQMTMSPSPGPGTPVPGPGSAGVGPGQYFPSQEYQPYAQAVGPPPQLHQRMGSYDQLGQYPQQQQQQQHQRMGSYDQLGQYPQQHQQQYDYGQQGQGQYGQPPPQQQQGQYAPHHQHSVPHTPTPPGSQGGGYPAGGGYFGPR